MSLNRLLKVRPLSVVLASPRYQLQLTTFIRRTSALKTCLHTMSKPKVLVTRQVPAMGLQLLSENYAITQWADDNPIPRDELLKKIAGVDALFCMLTDKIDSEVLDAAGPQLKVVATLSVGYDHVDISECKKRSILIGYTANVLTNATAELTVALLLATSRRIKEGLHAVVSGEWGSWKPLWLCGPDLDGSTVGIVGMGRIGLAVARRLLPFGVEKFLYFNRKRNESETEINAELVPFDDLLARSDYVIACCALTPETKGIFNKSAFAKMKNSAVFVNTSRGAIVNQDDLYEALTSREIFGAGLDVTTPEPLPTDSPLLALDNCTVLPHIGSATDKARAAMSVLTAKNIIAALKGDPMPCQVK